MNDEPPPDAASPGPAPPAEAEAEPSPATARWRRRGLVVGLGLVAILLPLWLRVAVEGQLELAEADIARAQDDAPAEIEHLGRALRWRAPLLDHDDEALGRLWAVGQEHQAEGRAGRALALMAYREIRRGLLATRSLGIPHRERWAQANAQIAALMAEQERDLGLRPAASDPEVDHRTRLERVPGPTPVRGHLAALAFMGWIGTVVGFLLRGLDGAGRLRPRPALRWGLGAVLALAAWMVLLAIAHSGPG